MTFCKASTGQKSYLSRLSPLLGEGSRESYARSGAPTPYGLRDSMPKKERGENIYIYILSIYGIWIFGVGGATDYLCSLAMISIIVI